MDEKAFEAELWQLLEFEVDHDPYVRAVCNRTDKAYSQGRETRLVDELANLIRHLCENRRELQRQLRRRR
jgi:hypothetical protein